MKNKKNKIYYIVMGGIGNQLFQFANAFALGRKYNLEIIAETNFAFFSNFKFKRKFKLNRIIKGIRLPSYFIQFKIFLFFLFKKFKFKTSIYFVNETDHRTFDSNIRVDNKKDSIILGYWQSEKYFSNFSEDLVSKINFPKIGSQKFNKLISLISSTNSVALCIRVYDELSADKTFVGGEEGINFYNNAIQHILELDPNSVFYIFSQKKYPILNNLKLNKSYHFIIGDNYKFDELHNLSLIINCKTHIISNSSFYWWGAWLSEAKKISKLIIASSKFSNKDAIPARWKIM